jgi:hypothetical protein
MSFMKDYKTVAERVHEAHQKGLIAKITTESPVMMNDVLGYIRVTVEFTDGMSAQALGTFRFDAKKGAQMTNPIEDAETSAVGRALAFLGIASSKSIASLEEINEAKQREQSPDIATMSRMIRGIQALEKRVKERGLVIDHDLASLKLHELAHDEMVTYGTYLRQLVNGE